MMIQATTLLPRRPTTMGAKYRRSCVLSSAFGEVVVLWARQGCWICHVSHSQHSYPTICHILNMLTSQGLPNTLHIWMLMVVREDRGR
ncbi:hypothetical protein M747DRAFT_108726 [Aspergillus niger ATCC 13496]|uniref:Uncharacterized protein n=1 Tax=Aspergillus niger ATCC 13496 TaxID=1353008 RepID=A0A370BRP9_ASPNG|nr:hypothetical protein M747DRAFT_108726 [Aspergillus niger ATCC 13496]